jgi:AcrR family transcriptional regulator
VRADAEGNRRRILEVARAALEAGSTPRMAAIAREAGVGQGTLYRHFATWSELTLAVHRDEMNALVAVAPELLETLAPLEALRAWLTRLAEYGLLKRDLGDAMHLALQEQVPTSDGALDLTALDTLLAAGRAAGVVREDVTPADLLQLVGFLWRLERTRDRAERCARLIDVVVSGLRPADGA